MIPVSVMQALTSEKCYQAASRALFGITDVAYLDVLMDRNALNFDKSLRDSIQEMINDSEPFYEVFIVAAGLIADDPFEHFGSLYEHAIHHGAQSH
jgi:hypothetical protein